MPLYLSHWVPHGITLFYSLQAYNKRSTSFGRKPLRSAPKGWGGGGRHDPWRVDGEIGSQARNSPISQSISYSFSPGNCLNFTYFTCMKNFGQISTTEAFAWVFTIIASGCWQNFSWDIAILEDLNFGYKIMQATDFVGLNRIQWCE